MPKLDFQYNGTPKRMRTYIVERGAVTPPEVLAAQQPPTSTAAPAATGPARPAPVTPRAIESRTTRTTSMSIWFWALLIAIALMGWLVAYMLAQRPITNAQQLLQQRRYEDAVMEANRTGDHLHRAEALKLLGRYDEAIDAYRLSTDPAAREGIAPLPRPPGPRARRCAPADGNADRAASADPGVPVARPRLHPPARRRPRGGPAPLSRQRRAPRDPLPRRLHRPRSAPLRNHSPLLHPGPRQRRTRTRRRPRATGGKMGLDGGNERIATA